MWGWDGIKGEVRIYDITGRVIIVSGDERFSQGELKEFYPPSAGSLLIVEVRTGTKRYLEKVILAKD